MDATAIASIATNLEGSMAQEAAVMTLDAAMQVLKGAITEENWPLASVAIFKIDDLTDSLSGTIVRKILIEHVTTETPPEVFQEWSKRMTNALELRGYQVCPPDRDGTSIS